jgi:hypothetical protein
MPHLTPGVYEPEILKVMGDTFDRAWQEFKPRPNNAELARNLMASAIIEAVEAGAVGPTILVDRALRALRAAIFEDRETPGAVDARHTGWKRLPLAATVSLLQSPRPWPGKAA